MPRLVNRAKVLVCRGVTVAKHWSPTDINKPHIFLGATVSDGIARSIGRHVDIQLTLEEAIKARDDLTRNIEDVAYRLGVKL